MDLQTMSIEELSQLHSLVGSVLEEKRSEIKKDAIDKAKQMLLDAGLSPRDLINTVPRTGNSQRRSSSRTPAFGKDVVLPALKEILKDGPVDRELLREKLGTKGLPLSVIGMMIRYGYITRSDSGQYSLGPLAQKEENTTKITV